MADKVVDLSLAKWGKTRTDGSVDWRRKQNIRMRHHSQVVVSLKVLLPSLAAVLIGLVILWPQLQARQDEAISIVSEDTAPQDQVMINPRFFTVDDKGERLNMSAENAYELPGDTRRIRLNQVKADILSKDDRFFALDAEHAVYAQSADSIDLSGAVNLYSEDGYELNTTQASIDLKTQNIAGRAETFVRPPAGTATSQGFQILNNGKLIRLTGKTRAVFYPDRKDGQ
ncbi:MAG TPA: LPS export ABC transporter periplasmic protein LptC [Alphaproteobacteria bacterium]|nr:LPS export ABC transporter periplasmic protein LptC [Alphaproteobacteria bacterium]